MDKKRLEDLSNLVFGLALTLGAITLTAPVNDDLGALFAVILRFALSFAIVVWIWWLYNNVVQDIEKSRPGLASLNMVLLFLVVIEPFLLTVSNDYSSGKIAYSIDLGTILVILAIFYQFAIDDPSISAVKRSKESLAMNRNLSFLFAAIFYTSIVPQLMLPGIGIEIQSYMWLAVLVLGLATRRMMRQD
jgi:uncharacterized membrane protein